MVNSGIYKNLYNIARKKGYEEDVLQEALRLVIHREGVEFLNNSKAPSYVVRSLSEAYRLTRKEGYMGNNVSVNDQIDIAYEINQPSYKPHNKLENILDKYIKRANLSNEQMQVLQAHLMDKDNRWIAKVFGIHVNSVTNKLNAIKDKLNAVHLGCVVNKKY